MSDSAPARRRLSFRFTLSTVLLLVAATAVWIAFALAQRETETLRRQLPGLRSAARELVLDDPSQFAVVMRHPTWFGETIWDLHVPSGRAYALSLALDQIPPHGFVEPLHAAQLEPGRHTIELRYERQEEDATAEVLLDGDVVLREQRPKDWEPGRGSSGGSQISENTALAADAPVLLLRRRFMPAASGPLSSKEPRSGLLLWIAPVEEAAPANAIKEGAAPD